MGQLSGSDNTLFKSENETRDGVWTEEHDRVPLKQRLKMLLASKRLSDFSDIKFQKESKSPSTPPIDIIVKKEDQHCDSQGSHPACAAGEQRNERFLTEQSNAGVLGEYSYQGTQVNEYSCSNRIASSEVNADTVRVEKVDATASTLLQCSIPSKHPDNVKVEFIDNCLMSSLENVVKGSSGAAVQVIKIKTEIPNDFEDDLDHIALKDRRRMLLSRKSLELRKPLLEGDSSRLSNPIVEDTIQSIAGMQKGESHSGDGEPSGGVNHTSDVLERNASDFCKMSEPGSLNGIIAGSSCTTNQCSALTGSCSHTASTKSGSFMGLQESDRICSSKIDSTAYESCGGQDLLSGGSKSMLSSASTTFVNVKVELLDNNGLQSLEKNVVGDFPYSKIVSVKSELETPDESYGDEVDHMLLQDRIKLMASREVPNLDFSRNFKCLRKIVPSAIDCTPIVSEPAKPLKISRLRKRRKTATDSVETALEEDAPGLLQVLIDKGVSVNEIKLYGEMESNEPLDESFSEDSFAELEAVISKLFSQRHSLLKFAPIRCTKGEKASYCLACLISLVEQARYLQFRKWPVEWGWCRDLQSFIFVFERHNRIVLERPEYGYATYFFELVDSLPIDWQIKRLVIAMKLTNCSRVNIIENKALLVGEDLTEGEARVLTEYGWIPNSGIGTMLNYRDRVVHDRKNESDSSEWRSKIGKLLMDGYNGGTIVSTDIPKKVVEYSGSQSPPIKLEL
uniref:Uncharacterized protein n=1 Tax=Davidia involucrata TaxID=16924 RepID=A0A5B6ZK40_DAVIN